MYWSHMQEIKLTKDYGNSQTQERWAGNFLTEEAYEQVVSPTEDTVIYKPSGENPLAYVVCNAYPDTKVVDCLKTIARPIQHSWRALEHCA